MSFEKMHTDEQRKRAEEILRNAKVDFELSEHDDSQYQIESVDSQPSTIEDILESDEKTNRERVVNADGENPEQLSKLDHINIAEAQVEGLQNVENVPYPEKRRQERRKTNTQPKSFWRKVRQVFGG